MPRPQSSATQKKSDENQYLEICHIWLPANDEYEELWLEQAQEDSNEDLLTKVMT